MIAHNKPLETKRIGARRGMRAAGASACLCAWTVLAGCGEPGRSADADVPLAATTEEVYAVGGADATLDWQRFVEVSKVRFDGAGNLVVLDRRQPRIAVVQADGSPRGFVSQAGDGPEELGSVGELEVLRDGRLVVRDRDALVLFDETGAFVERFADAGGRARTEALPGGSGRSTMTVQPVFVGALPGARFLALRFDARALEIHTVGEGSVELHRAPLPPLDHEIEGAVPVRAGGLEAQLPLAAILGGGVSRALDAFAPPFAAVALADGRVAVIDAVGYRVKILNDDGAVGGALERPIDQVPVTEEMRETAGQRFASDRGGSFTVTAETGGASVQDAQAQSARFREALTAAASQIQYSPEVPVLNGVAVDFENRIWVSRTAADGLSGGPTDVFTADGDYLGTLSEDAFRLPDAFGPSGLMAYVEADDLDVQTVRVARLTGLEPAVP